MVDIRSGNTVIRKGKLYSEKNPTLQNILESKIDRSKGVVFINNEGYSVPPAKQQEFIQNEVNRRHGTSRQVQTVSIPGATKVEAVAKANIITKAWNKVKPRTTFTQGIINLESTKARLRSELNADKKSGGTIFNKFNDIVIGAIPPLYVATHPKRSVKQARLFVATVGTQALKNLQGWYHAPRTAMEIGSLGLKVGKNIIKNPKILYKIPGAIIQTGKKIPGAIIQTGKKIPGTLRVISKRPTEAIAVIGTEYVLLEGSGKAFSSITKGARIQLGKLLKYQGELKSGREIPVKIKGANTKITIKGLDKKKILTFIKKEKVNPISKTTGKVSKKTSSKIKPTKAFGYDDMTSQGKAMIKRTIEIQAKHEVNMKLITLGKNKAFSKAFKEKLINRRYNQLLNEFKTKRKIPAKKIKSIKSIRYNKGSIKKNKVKVIKKIIKLKVPVRFKKILSVDQRLKKLIVKKYKGTIKKGFDTGKYGKHGFKHLKNVEKNMIKLRKKYKLKVSKNEIKASARLHDILKHRTIKATQEKNLSRLIKKGDLDKIPEIKRLTKREKIRVANAIGIHDKLRPNLWGVIRTSDLGKLLINADRMDLTRFGRKKVIHQSMLFRLKGKTKYIPKYQKIGKTFSKDKYLREKGYKYLNVAKKNVPTMSIAKQIGYAGTTQDLVSSQANRIIGLMRRSKVIRKPIPNEHLLNKSTKKLLKKFDKGKITGKQLIKLDKSIKKQRVKIGFGGKTKGLLERSFFAEFKIRPKFLRINKTKEIGTYGALKVLKNEGISSFKSLFKRNKPVVYFFPGEKIANLPKSLNALKKRALQVIKSKSKRDVVLSNKEKEILLKWNLLNNKTGKFKSLGFPTRELEFIASRGEIIKKVKTLARVTHKGEIVTIQQMKLVKPTGKIKELMNLARKGKLKPNKVKKLNKLLKKETGVDYNLSYRGIKGKRYSSYGKRGIKRYYNASGRGLSSGAGLLSKYKPKYKTSYKPKYKANYKPTYKTSYKPKYPGKYIPTYKPKYKPGYKTTYKPKYTPKGTPKYKTGYTPKIPKRTKIPKKYIPTLSRREAKKYKSPGKKVQGYDVYGLHKKKFIKLNLRPLKQQDALSRGTYAVDHSTAKTFKIIPKGFTKKLGNVSQKERNYFNRARKKVRGHKIRKGKRYSLMNKYIEKRRYGIDTRGEKRGLSLARLRKRLIGTRKTKSIKRRKSK